MEINKLDFKNDIIPVTREINAKDYIMIHKSELKNLAFDANTLNWMAETSDKAGAFILGIWLMLYGSGNYSKLEIYGSFLCGLFLTVAGILYKCQRNIKINKIINEKIEENK